MKKTPQALGTPVQLMLLGTVLLWGSSMPIVKWLTGSFDPLLLAGLRMTFAALALALLLRRRGSATRTLGTRGSSKELPLLLLSNDRKERR